VAAELKAAIPPVGAGSLSVRRAGLLGDPGGEALFQLFAVVGPELQAQLHRILGIGRRGRQVAQGLGVQQLQGTLVDRAVGDVVGVDLLVSGWLAKLMNFSARALFGEPFGITQ
jgi:hypothetical protein